MLCPNCENENRDGAKFCDECGFPLKDTQRETSEPVEDGVQAYDDEAFPFELYEEEALPAEGSQDEPGQEGQDENESQLTEQIAWEEPIEGRRDASVQDTVALGADLAGFDRHTEDYGERLVDPGYQAPAPSFRDGGTMQMPRLENDEAPKSRDYLASSTTKRKSKGKFVVIGVVAVLAVVAIAVFASYQMQVWGGKVVPDVSGMTEADARSVLSDQGFSVRAAQVKSDDTEGLVLLMDPAAGSRADEGSEVIIHIATTRVIPEVVGKTQDEAAKLLAEAGYENVTFQEKSSDKPKGTVIAVSPKEGERAKSTAEVVVKIAKPYVVPDVSGKSTADAIDAIEKSGLKYEVVNYDTEEYPEGTVVNTDPAAGTEVKKGAYIVINVAQARGTKLEELAASQLSAGTTVEKGGKSYEIESVDSVSYIGNNTVSYTATAREFGYMFGMPISNPETEQISGTIVFNENNQVVAMS